MVSSIIDIIVANGPILFQTSDVLPSNFENVAAGALKVLNNLAILDLKFMQRMLVSPY